MPDDVQTAAEDNAQEPRRMKGDEGEIEEHSLPDQIAADRYLGTKTVLDVQTRGPRFNNVKPPGAWPRSSTCGANREGHSRSGAQRRSWAQPERSTGGSSGAKGASPPRIPEYRRTLRLGAASIMVRVTERVETQ